MTNYCVIVGNLEHWNEVEFVRLWKAPMERRVVHGETTMGGTNEMKCDDRMGRMIVQVNLPGGWGIFNINIIDRGRLIIIGSLTSHDIPLCT